MKKNLLRKTEEFTTRKNKIMDLEPLQEESVVYNQTSELKKVPDLIESEFITSFTQKITSLNNIDFKNKSSKKLNFDLTHLDHVR